MPAVNLTRETWLATTVRTARDFGTRLVGLLGRGRLDPEEALWLVPCRAIHTFGMRFPIDVVFLDEGGEVVAMIEGLGPWRLSPIVRRARSVLELRAGTLRKSSTRVGDRVEVSAAAEATLDDLRGEPLGRLSHPDPSRVADQRRTEKPAFTAPAARADSLSSAKR